MNKTLTVIFDGHALQPESQTDLEPGARYLITIERALPEAQAADAWDVLETLAGAVEAPPDWASQHDHYLYGTPKQVDADEAQ